MPTKGERGTSARKRSAPARKRLPEYEAKRDFAITNEPAPGLSEPAAGHAVPGFVVHKHDATRLHYDVRLEMDGALASWSVPKGPSYDAGVKRLAIQTEDHPLEYGKFEGRIPDGEYGAGDSLIWDNGSCESVPPGQLSQQRKKGHLVVDFKGHKLNGQWHLVRTHGGAPGKAQWLMFKAKDGTENAAFDVVAERPESVVSGRIATRGPERQGKLGLPRPTPDKLLVPLVPPMLATLVDAAPRGDWLIELKYDGYRAVCAVSNQRVAMWTRNSLDLTARFPSIARALGQLVVGDAVIDGEVAILDAAGVPRFELIQQGHNDEAVLFAFDLLRLDGEDLRGRPLNERRDLLRSLLSNAPANLRVSEELPPPIEAALAEVKRRGGEGVMLKAPGSIYEKGRSREWLKLKAQATQELAIVGWMPGKGGLAGGLGALLLGVAEGDGFVFAGKVGTGFSVKQRKELQEELSNDGVDHSIARGAPRLREARWVEPRLVAQVRFTEWTADGKLRHPAFQGLRADKTPRECVREATAQRENAAAGTSAPGKPAAPAKSARPVAPAKSARSVAAAKSASAKRTKARAGAASRESPERDPAAPAASVNDPEVPLSNPGRVLYPRDGLTKLDVVAYYQSMSGPLLAAVAQRPLTLVHWNQGIDKASWFQQNIGDELEPWMTTVGTPSQRRIVRHLVADRPAALRWLAQMSVLELHAWHSRKDSLTMPDWVLFDLDPADGADIEQSIEVAQILHGMFERLSLPSVVKTTGKRGLHVLVPLLPGHTFEDAEAFALQVGETVAKQLPKLVTLERAKAKRHGRLYFDCLQNAYGKTAVAAYSLRGLDGAPVSAPLRWSEVKPGLDPRSFNLKTMPERLRQAGDLFAPARDQGVRLPRYKK